MNKWSLFGSLTLMLGGIGHFLIVDLPVWILKADFVHWLPKSLLPEMKTTTLHWDIMGQNNFARIFSGFSLWMVFSLLATGIFNLMIFRGLQAGHKLRKQSLLLSLIVSIIFLVLASICFIYPPIIGGILAVIFFGLAIRKEKQMS